MKHSDYMADAIAECEGPLRAAVNFGPYCDAWSDLAGLYRGLREIAGRTVVEGQPPTVKTLEWYQAEISKALDALVEAGKAVHS